MDFSRFYGIKIAKLDAIQLQIGLPLNIDQITGQNKFEGQRHIPKNVAKMAILWPKIASILPPSGAEIWFRQ